MSGIVFENDNPDTRYKFNQLARHQQVCKLYNDILVDLKICELEGWDKTEYINELYKIIDHFRQATEKVERGVDNGK